MRQVVGYLFVLVSQAVLADRSAYNFTRDIEARGNTLVVRHHHDWSRVPRDSDGWRLRFSAGQPFGVSVETSRLEFLSPEGVLLARVPSPPLTYLTVSADGQYVIGLSTIKFLNSTQAVVFDKRGT